MSMNQKEALAKLMTGLDSESERQLIMASVEGDMVDCPVGQERAVHESFKELLTKMGPSMDHSNTGFYLMFWVGTDAKGNLYATYDLGGGTDTLRLCSQSLPFLIQSELQAKGHCACDGCTVRAKIRALTRMQEGYKTSGRGTDA